MAVDKHYNDDGRNPSIGSRHTIYIPWASPPSPKKDELTSTLSHSRSHPSVLARNAEDPPIQSNNGSSNSKLDMSRSTTASFKDSKAVYKQYSVEDNQSFTSIDAPLELRRSFDGDRLQFESHFDQPLHSSSNFFERNWETLWVVFCLASVVLEAVIVSFVYMSDPKALKDVEHMGEYLVNFSKSVFDTASDREMEFRSMPIQNPRGITPLRIDEGVPRAHWNQKPSYLPPSRGCGFENSFPLTAKSWSPIRGVVCPYEGETTVHLNEWIDRLPYDGVILSAHEYYALSYLHDSIADELVFLDKMSREGVMAACVLPLPG